MFGVLLATVCLCASLIRAHESEALSPANKSECVDKFIRWCDSMEYPKDGGRAIMVTLSYHGKDNSFNRVFCLSDSYGTNCTRNGSPWFACTPDHNLTYNGAVLSGRNATASNIDDGICETVDKAFGELMVQNILSDNATLPELHEGLESFFEELANMQEQMDEIFRVFNNLNSMGRDGFVPRDRDLVTEVPESGGNAPQDSNQIERE